MLTIRKATTAEIPLIQHLTNLIWRPTYSSILSSEQIDYMLAMMYSSDALAKQIEEQQHHFLICYDEEVAVGFASYSPIGENIFKLHKIYVRPNQQGKGVGKFIVAHIVDAIRPRGATALDLNVNRHNPAKSFYEKLGFTVLREEDIDIGGGYWMNDFVMRFKL